MIGMYKVIVNGFRLADHANRAACLSSVSGEPVSYTHLDNEKMVEVLGRMIEEDHDLKLVGKAHNGEEICNIIREKEPDVVILDIIMPKMDGLTVMEQCSHDQTVKKLPSFIVVSAVGQERITEDAFNLGADLSLIHI